jgi:hypothetical protein
VEKVVFFAEMLLLVVAGRMPMLVALEFEEGKRNTHIVRYLLTAATQPAKPDARGYMLLHNAAEEVAFLLHFRNLLECTQILIRKDLFAQKLAVFICSV